MNLFRKNQVNNLTEEDNTNIRVFGNDDESLRILGQILSNETSRKIIQLLTQEEMYTNQISKRLGIQMNTIIFHLKKLVEVGLVTVTHKQIIKKGVDHKYYKMIPNIFVTSTQPKKEVHANGFLKKFFKEGIKFAAIGFLSIITWKYFVTLHIPEINNNYNLVESTSENLTIPIIIFSIIGVLIYLYLKKRKKGL